MEEFNLGKELSIPADLLGNLASIDEKIQSIASDSEAMAKGFNGSISLMTDSADGLLRKMGQLEGILNALSGVKTANADGLADSISIVSDKAEKAANQLAKVSESLSKIDSTISSIGDNKDLIKALNALDKLERLNEINRQKNDKLQVGRDIAQQNREAALEAKRLADNTKEQEKAENNRHRTTMAALDSENAQRKLTDSLMKKYTAALSMSEATEMSRIKKIERLRSVYSELNEIIGAEANETRRAANAVNRLVAENDRLNSSREEALKRSLELREKMRSAYGHKNADEALGAITGADTYNKRKNAIKDIELAIKSLSVTDRNYERDLNRLSAAHRKLSEEQRKVESHYKDIKESQGKMLDTASQLARKLALVFSVSQIQNYLMNVVKVTGEFEKQNVALASILQNKDQADKLFGQITELAVKSPFQLKELITYTKSLSAYQVEYEKLYDTTKRLADVSAGLGVDMQRLILAFGQVKAANFLRGTEVRQFTEAGLNILGELAKYYSELEGRMVSVGEVQERVTKRMVAFGDVEEVFKRITSAGGIFYEMQEKQAETLAGQISNLSDSIDIMLNSIGQENYGVIQGSVKIIRSLVDNWRTLANIIQSASVGMVAYASVTIMAAKANNAFAASNIAATASQKGLVAMTAKAVTALKSFFHFLKANPYVVLITAIGSATLALLDHKKAVQKNLAEYDTLARLAAESKKEVNGLISQIQSQNDKLNSLNKEMDSLERNTKEYENAEREANKERQKQNRLLLELKKNYPEIYAGIVKQKDGTVDLTKAQISLNEELERTNYLVYLSKKGEGLFSDGLLENIKDASEAQKEFNSSASELENKYRDAVGRAREVLALEKGLSKETRKGLNDIINGTGTITEKAEKLYKFAKPRAYLGGVANELQTAFFNFQRSAGEVEDANNKVGRSVDDVAEKYKSYYNVSTEEGKKYAEKSLKTFLETLKLEDKSLRDFVAKKFMLKLGIQFDFDEGKKERFGDVAERINKYLSKQKFDFVPKIKSTEGSSEFFKKLSAEYQSLVEQAEKAKKATESVFENKSKEEGIKELDEKIKQYEETLKYWGEFPKKIESKQESVALKNLKNIISLLKEAQKEYRKYLDYYNQDAAMSKVREDFAGTPISSILEKYNLDNKGIKNAIKNIAHNAGEAGNREIDKVIRSFDRDIELSVQIKDIDQTKAKIDSIFKDYELNISLSEKDIDVDAFRNMLKDLGANDEDFDFLGLKYINIEEALEGARKELAKLREKGGAKRLEEARNLQKQITSIEVQEATKRFDELISLRQKYLSREKKILKLEEDIEKWKAELAKTTNDEMEELLRLRIQNANDAILKLKSEGLELTDFWRNLFGDLEDLSLRSVRRIADQRDEILNNAQPIVNKNGEQVGYSSSYTDSDGNKQNITLTISQFNQLIKAYKRLDKAFDRDPIGKFFRTLAKGRNQGEGFLDFLTRMGNDFESAGNAAFSAAGDIMGMLNASDEQMKKLQDAKDIFGGAMDIGKGALGIASGNFIGGTLSALKGVSAIVQKIGQIKDRKKEKQIKREIELVENLEKSYENLEKAINNAYSLDTLDASNKKAEKNLKEQNAALERAIKKEDDKKKTDHNRIKEWENQIEDNNERIKELRQERIDALGGLGSDEKVKSAAEDFASAWYDAFKETGDGLNALGENFQQMLDNILKKQIMLKATDSFLKPLFDQINSIFGGDSEVTKTELDSIKDKADEMFPKLNSYLKDLMNSLGVLGGQAQDKMSGLQRGIQGITEPTAEALAAITESIRYFVADSNAQLKMLISEMSTPTTNNAFLAEMRIQTEELKMMNSLWNSLTMSKSGVNGKALKVNIV